MRRKTPPVGEALGTESLVSIWKWNCVRNKRIGRGKNRTNAKMDHDLA